MARKNLGQAFLILVVGIICGFILDLILTHYGIINWNPFWVSLDNIGWASVWAGLEALATFTAAAFAGYVVFKEIPKLHQETAEKQVESLLYIEQYLEVHNFNSSLNFVSSVLCTGKEIHLSSEVDKKFRLLFSHLDFVSLLIEKGYLDKNLFFYKFLEQLNIMETIATKFTGQKKIKINELRKSFPKADQLLKDAVREQKKKEKTNKF